MKEAGGCSSGLELRHVVGQASSGGQKGDKTVLRESPSTRKQGVLSYISNRLSSWFHVRHQEEGEIDMLQQKRIREIPLLLAAKENRHLNIKKWLACGSHSPFQRGAVGETALHVAALYDNFEAVCSLLDAEPSLINEPMTSDLYEGQMALHIAVLNQNVKIVKELIGRGANVSSPRATGTFFKRGPQNIIYFGEHVLSFAACVGNEGIVRLLIENGANIKAQDSLGNTVLHVLALQPIKSIYCQMYDLILSYDAKTKDTPLDKIQNKDGLTPFKLAAVKGNTGLFQHIVKKRRHVQCLFGPVTSSLYHLSGIDSWEDNESVLELVTSTGNQEAYRILGLSPVKELVKMKWKTYRDTYFFASGILYVMYMICFTLCCINRPLMPFVNATLSSGLPLLAPKTLQDSYVTVQDFLRLVGELICVTGAIAILLLQITDVLHSGYRRFFRQTIWAEPFSIIIMAFALLILVILVMRVTTTDGEEIPMAIAVILGWCYILYFSRGSKLVGPFTIMIQKMAYGDLLRFFWLMTVVILGYSTALFVAFQEQEQLAFGAFENYPISLISTYELFHNILNGPANYTVENPIMYGPLYCSFCVIAFLLMFNLLIATLGDTHSNMDKEKDELWRAQIAAAAIMMEHRLPKGLWHRSGFSGKEYGLEDRWYINVDDRNDHSKQKMRQIVEQSDEDSAKRSPETDTPEKDTPEQIFHLQGAESVPPAPPKELCQRKPLWGWKVVRSATLDQLQGISVDGPTARDEERVYHV
ncbi:transient receptor potential cation channel subfamily V member 6-like [Lissotriton helveticus]